MNRPASEIALIGLGNMGSAMAAQWIAAGVTVHGFDANPDAVRRLVDDGGVGHESAAQATRAAKVCILMLPNSEIVDAVIDDLLETDAFTRDHVLIDMSSSQPHCSIDNARKLKPRGVSFIDAPVSGGVRGVVNTNLAILVGGDQDVIDASLPLLTALGNVTRVGEVGAGHAAKALNNMVSAAHLWATSEAVLAADRFGINRETMVEVLNASTGRSVSSEVKWPRFILNDAFDSGFQATLLAKDTVVARELMASMSLTPYLVDTVAELWSRASRELPPHADHTEVARWIDTALDENRDADSGSVP